MRKMLLDIIKSSFLSIKGARFFLPEDRKEEISVLRFREKTLRGVPSIDELRWVR
jgi:hypothetical protein